MSACRHPRGATSTATPRPKSSTQGATSDGKLTQSTKAPDDQKTQGDNIPENPQCTDEILLQDIYAQMDLGQFALDPAAEIPMPNTRRGKPMSLSNLERPDTHPPGKFNLAEVRDHPYLHMFPGLKYAVELAAENSPRDDLVEYGPRMELGPMHSGKVVQIADADFIPQDGISRFIYNPWFEPISTRDYEHLIEQGVYNWFGYGYAHFSYGPHWFGNNSTRGTLSVAVAKALEEAKQPGVVARPIPWQTYSDNYEEVAWRLDDYLRTPVYEFHQHHGEFKLDEHSFRVPTTYWEFVHPNLPIVKITSHVATLLPLKHSQN